MKANTLKNFGKKNFSFIITVVLFFVFYLIGMIRYETFSSPQVFYNLFVNNAHLLIVGIGITFVLLIGGIDISVGSTVALVSMIVADLLEKGWNTWGVIGIALSVGSLIGIIQGAFITYFGMQPFIVTLVGQFFGRGMTAVISERSISIEDATFKSISLTKISMPGGTLTIGAIVALSTFVIAVFMLKYTKFGRNVYAVGGGEQSSLLMGLPVKRTKMLVYTLSGFCASLGGLAYALNILSGYTQHGVGLEMDAIAAAVIGGTLLTGGVGFMPGTLFGVLIQGTIYEIIRYENLLSWWSKIANASLLCIFIIVQSVITAKKQGRSVDKLWKKYFRRDSSEVKEYL